MSAFTIRVYALLFSDQMEVLLLDECFKGREFTKFPGGGLEFGEGPMETILRELKEELQLVRIELEHFYTTDFFVQSAFHSQTQVLSIYYKGLTMINKDELRLDQEDDKLMGLRWLPLEELTEDHLTFPIDKKVAGMLKLQATGNN